MALSWQERLTDEPEWFDLSRWPLVDTSRLSPEHRLQFHRNQRIVAGVLAGRSSKDVAEEMGRSPALVSQLMSRCLGGRPDHPPALSQALIPHKRIQSSRRKLPLSTLASPCGDRCSFEFLLQQVPGLEDHLLKHIRMAVNRSRRGQNLTPRRFHAHFIAYLDSQAWPRDAYPFTSHKRGYETVRLYLKRELQERLLPKLSQRVIGSRLPPVCAFREIHIDEAHIDCHGAVAVILRHQMKPVRLGRISLLLARDVGTGCYLGAAIALTAHPSAADVLSLLEQLVQPWQCPALTTPGLSYATEKGFPSALSEAFCRPAFGIVRMDNALAHLSHQVRRMVCDHLSATCNLGLPKNPKARALIEQAFRRLNLDIHRFPSTTGSHPTDSRREPPKLQKEPPYVSLHALEEAVSILVIEFNASPLANQGGVTPLEQMAYQMSNHLLPLRAASLGSGLGPYERMKTATVRKGFTADVPRINFEGCQYQGVVLNTAGLINQKVLIVFDIRDVRQLKVSTLDGKNLGVVYAPKTWLRFAHSLALRKKINHMIRENVFSKRDPLGSYFNYTLAHRQLPKQALEMTQVARAMAQETNDTDESPTPAPSEIHRADDLRLTEALKQLPDWTPDMVNKRR